MSVPLSHSGHHAYAAPLLSMFMDTWMGADGIGLPGTLSALSDSFVKVVAIASSADALTVGKCPDP